MLLFFIFLIFTKIECRPIFKQDPDCPHYCYWWEIICNKCLLVNAQSETLFQQPCGMGCHGIKAVMPKRTEEAPTQGPWLDTRPSRGTTPEMSEGRPLLQFSTAVKQNHEARLSVQSLFNLDIYIYIFFFWGTLFLRKLYLKNFNI